MTQKRIPTVFVRCECGHKHAALIPSEHGELVECKCGGVVAIDYEQDNAGLWRLSTFEQITNEDRQGAMVSVLLRRGQN